MDTISLISGSYCKYFEPVLKENADTIFAVNVISLK